MFITAIIKETYIYDIIDGRYLYSTCKVAFKLNLEWKNTNMSTSMMNIR